MNMNIDLGIGMGIDVNINIDVGIDMNIHADVGIDMNIHIDVGLDIYKYRYSGIRDVNIDIDMKLDIDTDIDIDIDIDTDTDIDIDIDIAIDIDIDIDIDMRRQRYPCEARCRYRNELHPDEIRVASLNLNLVSKQSKETVSEVSPHLIFDNFGTTLGEVFSFFSFFLFFLFPFFNTPRLRPLWHDAGRGTHDDCTFFFLFLSSEKFGTALGAARMYSSPVFCFLFPFFSL